MAEICHSAVVCLGDDIMNRNLFISVATVMLYVGVQSALNVADARICFLVGGKCSDNTTLFDDKKETNDKDCDALGYKMKSCPTGQIPVASCTEFGVTYYKCKCDTVQYPVKASDVSSPYEVTGDVCTDDYGDHYKYKRCNSGYKYLSSSNDVSSSIGKCYQTYHNRDITIKNNDYVCTDACEEKDLLSTCPSNLTSIMSTKYKSCSCNPDVFKYSAPQNSTVFKVSGACTYASGTHYKTKTCTGNAAAGGGYWGATCNNDEYSVPGEDKVEDGVTCHLCKKACTDMTLDDCKIALLSASTSANSKQCKKVGTNCYKLAEGGVCPVEPVCTYTTKSACESANSFANCTESDSCYYPSSCKSPYSTTEPSLCHYYQETSATTEKLITKTATKADGGTLRCYTKEAKSCSEYVYHGNKPYQGWSGDYGVATGNPMTLYETISLTTTGSTGCSEFLCSNYRNGIILQGGETISCVKYNGNGVNASGQYTTVTLNGGSTSGLTSITSSLCTYNKDGKVYKVRPVGNPFYLKE